MSFSAIKIRSKPEARAGQVPPQSGCAHVRPDEWPSELTFADGINPAFLREHCALPLNVSDRGVTIAIADPANTFAIDAIRLAFMRPVIVRHAPADEIEAAIQRLCTAKPAQTWADDEAPGEISEDVEQLRDLALGTPVVVYVSQLFQDGLLRRATDIHIEPFRDRLIVRMRVDGMLREVDSPPTHLAKAIVSRVKIISGLNIAERRMPQDGRARIRIEGRSLDLRVATMPTVHGEAVAIRLLDNVRRALDFANLGFSPAAENVLRRHLSAPYGLIVVTGPTGSGKTTTLATALAHLNGSERKILTIEDPIEYEIEGINQTQAKPGIGLTFAAAMRSFLRHDPDVIMVGEMRDTETAKIGVHAALTGHLVLTTLHTNSAAGAIPRLLDMGVDGFLLASSLRCVVGQRLVRVLCAHCKSPPSREGAPWQPVGCERCYGSGYADRVAISEVLDVSDNLRAMIRPGVSVSDIAEAARQEGMATLFEDGMAKAARGATTPDEVRRVALDV